MSFENQQPQPERFAKLKKLLNSLKNLFLGGSKAPQPSIKDVMSQSEGIKESQTNHAIDLEEGELFAEQFVEKKKHPGAKPGSE